MLRATVVCLLLAAGASIAAPALAQPNTQVFDIPAQTLEAALRQLASKERVQILFLPEDVKGMNTAGVKGRFTPLQAIEELIKGTGLRVSTNGENVFAIKPTPPAREKSSEAAAAAALVETQKLESITVTAQRREELLRDVPISIATIDGRELDRSTYEGVTEALRSVPGVVTMSAGQGGNTQLSIRGVTAAGPLFFGASAIGYYIDSIPFALVKSAVVPDTSVYDMERVEVLRGPQGTLYGASALNGVVRILTKEANLFRTDFSARASTSYTKDGDWNYRGDMAFNFPVVDGKFAARVSLGYQDVSGWIDKPDDENVNDGRIRNFRFKAHGQPADALSLGFSAWISRSDFGAPNQGRQDNTSTHAKKEPMSTDFDVYGLKLGYEFPAATLGITTSYFDYANFGILDYQSLIPDTTLDTRLESRVWTTELNLTSTHAGPWKWSLGAMYRDGEDKVYQFRRQYVQPTQQRNLSTSYAVFGELTHVFADPRIELTAGLRYFKDDVAGREDSRLNGAPPSALVSTDSSFDATTPRVVLSWRANERTTAYASYGEGFRSGFDQNPAILALAPLPSVVADTLRNYEVGVKGNSADNRLAFEAAAYYIEWKDVQQPLLVNANGVPLAAVINGVSASGPGVELSSTARPFKGVELGASVSWNDLKQDADVRASNGTLFFGEGERLNFSAKYTAGAWLDWVFPLAGDGTRGRFSAAVNYTSKIVNKTLVGTNVIIATGDAMTLGRVRFAVEWPSRWTVVIYADNINNEDGSPVRSTFVPGNWDMRIRPRTIGAQVEYRF